MGNNPAAIKEERQRLYDVISSNKYLKLRYYCPHGNCKLYADMELEVEENSVYAWIGERKDGTFEAAHNGHFVGHWETGTATLALVRCGSKKTTYLRLTYESPTKLIGSITKQRNSDLWPAYERQLHVHI